VFVPERHMVSCWVAEQIRHAFVVATTPSSLSFLPKDVKMAKQVISTRLQRFKQPE
jgi:hypothetical protein